MIGQVIKQTRKLHKLSGAKVAESVGIAESHLNRIENGKIKPTFDLVERILDSIGYQLVINQKTELV